MRQVLFGGLMGLLFVASIAETFADGWKPAGDKIKTRWAKDVTPRNAWKEYPRPQMLRDDWQNLNGLWNYTVVKKKGGQYIDVSLVYAEIEN